MNARIFASSVAALLLVTASASASDTDPRTTADLQWFGHAGATSGKGFGGALIGATFLARSDLFAVGATVEGSGLLASRFAIAATGGLSYRDPSGSGFGVDLLGGLGVHRYSGIGKGILSDDPGASATLPYASARLRGVYVFGTRKRHFQLGASATIDRDLSRVTREYTYTETPWLSFSGDPQPETMTAKHEIGFTTVGAMIDAGMTFDLL